jgi:queuine/archaeosine tRNA-ribosyltransferase
LVIRAKHGEYYWDGLFYDLRDPMIRFEECYCEACRGMMPQDIIDLWFEDEERAMKTLAMHNLLDLSRLKRRR